MNQDKLTLIASQYDTPSYIFDVSALNHQVHLIREMLPAGTMLCFAVKANPFLAGTLSKITDRLEVCSPGEYEICIREHINPEQIVVSGVNKTKASLERILSYSRGAGIYTIESELHYQLLKQCAGKADQRLRVLLRLSSGNQFGMEKTSLERVLSMIQSDNIMDIAGIHYYSGTQKKPEKIKQELQELETCGKDLQLRYGTGPIELEYGPGLSVSYFENEKASQNDKEQLKTLGHCLENMKSYSGTSIELGRFLTADCGYYITRIMDIKHTEKTNFLIVDGGIHQINYYGQMLGMKKPFFQLIRKQAIPPASPYAPFTICGSLCTANDVLMRDVKLQTVNTGDILVFERCGAYAVTEGMALFLSRELPQVLLVDEDGTTRILREKTETYLLNKQMEDNENGRIN